MEVLGEGDAASEVLRRLHESQVAREQVKTKEELEAIKNRIQCTLEDYDDSSKLFGNFGDSNMKLVTDMEELEAILKDGMLRNKYQQKLTIFIVGYQTLCSQRADILSQLAEFFSTYSVDENNDGMMEAISDSDVEGLQLSVQDALDSIGSAVTKLGDVGSDVINYMERLHSAASSKSTKSKKKLEKALQNAKDEILKMTNKLLNVQQDLGMKEERLQQMRAQIDAKRVEISHLKTQMVTNKKTAEKIQDGLKHERSALQLTVEKLQMEVERLQDEAKEVNREEEEKGEEEEKQNVSKNTDAKLKEIKDAAVVELQRLKTRMEAEELDVPAIQKELAEQFQIQLQQISDVYEEEVANWKQECTTHVCDILEMDLGEDDVQQWTQRRSNDEQGQSDASKERPKSTYHTSSVNTDVKHPSTAESAVRPSKQQKETDVDLMDEEYWKNIPADDLASRFAEFRLKARNELSRATEGLHAARAVKENLASEASRWQEERATLLAHIEQLKVLQEAAEADAEEAMRNLEEFAAEQEKTESGNFTSTGDVGASGDGDFAGAEVEASSLTEDNIKSIGDSHVVPSSPSSFSKPASAATSRLASAYRQKIVDRREAIRLRKERLRSASTPASPHFKGMIDTSLLEEFLKCYRAVVEFKDLISQEMSRHVSHHSKAHSINSVQTSNYDASNDEVQLYVTNMTSSVEQVLRVIQDNVMLALNETRDSQSSNELERMRLQSVKLQNELTELRAESDRRTQHDAAMINHLQNTLSETLRGNTAGAGTSGSGFPSSPAGPMMGKSPPSSSQRLFDDSNLTVMFTRLDAEHNSKALKKSAAVGRITQETLESVVMTMEAYNAIPAKRIQHLASKLVHHSKMKIIETNVRNSNLVTSEVFAVLEKMELLQRRRSQNWIRHMDAMTSERRRLAALLSDALQRLETITGVFLIKPVVSYKGNSHLRKYSGKISTRFNKYQIEAMMQKIQMKQATSAAQASYAAVQANAGTSSMTGKSSLSVARQHGTAPSQLTRPAQNSDPLSVHGLFTQRESTSTWSVNSSLAKNSATSGAGGALSPTALMRTTAMPKLLELDLTRYQIPSSNVHALITGEGGGMLSNDRLKNMELFKRRSHTTVEWTGFNLKASQQETQSPEQLPVSRTSTAFKSTAPPTTPALLLQMSNEGDERSQDGPLDDDDGDVIPPITVITTPIPKPLPPIKRSSARSSVTSVGSTRNGTPRSAGISPSRSVPDLQARVEAVHVPTTPLSDRKDMATSPVGDG